MVAAVRNLKLSIPVVVRLEGTNAEEAREIVARSSLGEQLLMAEGLRDAAEKSAAAAARA